MRETPRPWQVAAAERALKENIVVVAETGAGKTLVASLAAEKAVSRGKVAFIVPVSRLLAHQQFVRLRGFLKGGDGESERARGLVEVTGYTASTWGEREWRDCRERYDVFVGTAEIFRKAFVDHGFLRLRDFSLIVVDECHHVGGNSGIAEIMMMLHFNPVEGQRRPSRETRVLGLTASFAGMKAQSRGDFVEARQDLLDAMQAVVEPCAGLERREPPIFKKIDAGKPPSEVAESLAGRLCEHIWACVKEQGVHQANEKLLQKVTSSLGSVLRELGKDAFMWAVENGVVAQIEGKIDNWQAMTETQSKAKLLEADLDSLKRSIAKAAELVREQLERAVDVAPVSEKVFAAARAPLEDFPHLQGGSGNAGNVVSGMFFVDEVALAAPLSFLLQRILGQDVEVASGVQSMSERERNGAFQRFRSGRSRLLVCTACAEEGVDVSACAFVARFSEFNTTRSHVQGAGRARLPGAVIYYMENDPPQECQRADLMREVAEDQTLPGPSSAVRCVQPGFQRIPGVHPFIVPETGAEAKVSNAHHLLQLYLCQVTRGGASLKAFHGEGGGGGKTRGLRVDGSVPGGPGLLLPGLDGGCLLANVEVQRFWGDRAPVGVDHDALTFYVAVLVLHARGWLDNHNQPTREVLKRAVWPVDPDRAWRLSLGPGWQPPGLLGGQGPLDVASGDLAPPSRNVLDGRSREHFSSGTQQVHLQKQQLNPLAIRNTQTTVNKTFSNGNSVFDTMVLLARSPELQPAARKKMTFEDFPQIRVSSDPESGEWYSADNRRCFVFKVVAPILGVKLVEVDVINWTEEFRSKIGQAPRVGDTWTTDDKSVDRVRAEVRAILGERKPPARQAGEVVDEALRVEADSIAQRAATAGAGLAPAPASLLPASLGRPRSRAVQNQGKAEKRAQLGPEVAEVDHPVAEPEGEAVPSRSQPMAAAGPQPASPPEHVPAPELASTLAAAAGQGEAAAMLRVGRALEHLAHPPPAAHPPPPSREQTAELADLLAGLSAVARPPQPPAVPDGRPLLEERPLPERDPDEAEHILELVVQSLADTRDISDPISALNVVVQGHHKPRNGEVRPLHFRPFVETPEGKVVTVEVCGLEFTGQPCGNKNLAKRSAAEKAIEELVRRARR